MEKTFILWDWNGTLLDDTAAALGALNAMLARRKLPPIAMDWYRANFRFPVRPFYESMGLKIRDDEWDALALEYHQTYLRQPRELAKDARAALELARSAGLGQVIVSALRQDLLERDVAQYGVGEFFAGLYGTDNLDGAAKLAAARKAAASIRGEDGQPGTPEPGSESSAAERANGRTETFEPGSESSAAERANGRTETFEPGSESSAAERANGRAPILFVIGDSRHDREAADAVGAACVLHSCGTHTRERLEPFAPVADSLVGAVRLVLEKVS